MAHPLNSPLSIFMKMSKDRHLQIIFLSILVMSVSFIWYIISSSEADSQTRTRNTGLILKEIQELAARPKQNVTVLQNPSNFTIVLSNDSDIKGSVSGIGKPIIIS